LGYERLKKENPAIIHASVTDFGSSGPRARYKSCDLVASAYGGHMGVTGPSKGLPLKLYGKQSYYAASLFAACSILLTVHKRNKLKKGEHLEITLHEAVTSSLEHVMVRYFAEQFIPKRKGGDHWDDLFFLLPCKDGLIQMTIFQNWETVIELMSHDGVSGDFDEAKWKDEKYRRQNKDHLLRVLRKWTSRFTRHELFEMGQLMRFPWAPVQKPDEILSCPHLKARRYFKEQKFGNQTIIFPRLPFKLSTPVTKRKDFIPFPGEHNLAIYRDELGMSETDIKELASMGII
jgi:crotonobetainyl-CoA:carnitine CoA-transferase CaiB-like acyl-CoA transferase